MKKAILLIVLFYFCHYTLQAQRGIPGDTAPVSVVPSGSWKIDDKVRSKVFLVSGAVVGGSGIFALFLTGVIAIGEDPSGNGPRHSEQQKRDIRTGLITSGSLIAASVPLFVLGRHYRKKYRSGVVLQLRTVPGWDHKGNGQPMLTTGLVWRF